jgi:hypothetical protein
MATDYARRPYTSQRGARRRGRSGRSTAEVGFSWGSFLSGMVIGVALTLTGALLPHWWPSAAAQLAVTAKIPAEDGIEPRVRAPGTAVSAPQFTFWDELPRDRSVPRDRNTRDRRDPSPSVSATSARPAPAPSAGIDFLLQAGSFARNEDAERLRSSLLLQGLDASTVTVTLPGGIVRHRVLVGPFVDERAMRRAQTQLREQDIDPLPLRRTPG